MWKKKKENSHLHYRRQCSPTEHLQYMHCMKNLWRGDQGYILSVFFCKDNLAPMLFKWWAPAPRSAPWQQREDMQEEIMTPLVCRSYSYILSAIIKALSIQISTVFGYMLFSRGLHTDTDKNIHPCPPAKEKWNKSGWCNIKSWHIYPDTDSFAAFLSSRRFN